MKLAIRHFHVVVVRKVKTCKKKRDARAKLLFCVINPLLFLTSSLPSPSSLLKLPNKIAKGERGYLG